MTRYIIGILSIQLWQADNWKPIRWVQEEGYLFLWVTDKKLEVGLELLIKNVFRLVFYVVKDKV
jgi:hypothetical protein